MLNVITTTSDVYKTSKYVHVKGRDILAAEVDIYDDIIEIRRV